MSHPVLPSFSEIDACLLVDQSSLKNRLKGLQRRKKEGKPYDLGLASLKQQMERSRQIVEQRQQTLPEVSFPAELPVSERAEDIAGLIRDHQVIVLCGETGSGKSTQLPKICLMAGRGLFGRIGHTQPRRIAARSLASRISDELGRELGASVGYKVRFHDRVSPQSHIKLMTDGILLAEIQHDRDLLEYDTLIIDEAHERSLNIDFLLGYLKKLLPRRPDLKVIITSATIDPEKFSRHFSDAPIINVSGRTYPVEVRYRPAPDEAQGERDDLLQQAIVDAVDELSRIDRGDILIFLSGEREIRETAETLRKHKLQLTELYPLFARLGPADQAKIFQSTGKRHIVLSTNVAETSLTVPGIRYVIDSGYARISRYSHRSKVQRLPVERISQASANQRKGRCGRVAEGVCIRLYTEEDFDSRAEFTEPEILRTNLASVILQMKILGFGEIEKFPFVEMPDKRLIKDGYRILEEIGAVSADQKVTRIGQQLARLAVDPRIGRMLLTAAHTHCLNELLVIAAALAVQDPRDRPLEKQQQADESHHEFRHEESDFLSYLNLWRHLAEQRRHLSKRKFINYCRSRFLSWTRVQEWYDIHHQLRGQLHEMGYKENQAEAGYEEIHKAILTGLLSHVGCKAGGKEHDYLGSRNSRFMIFPGSGLFKKSPKWVMAAELVETTRLYARTVALVKPEWIESVAGHLLKRSYSEPHWEKNRGQVAAYEKVTLFGLTIIPRRKVNYGPINPVEAREIFIRFALVEGDFSTRAPFWRHNRELRDHVEHLEQKARRGDLLVDEELIYEYYDKRIEEGIYSTPQFDKWLRRITREQPKILHMQLDDLLRREEGVISPEQYPDSLDINGMELPLDYRFDPGDAHDGVTLRVPRTIINQIPEARCEWLVPGLLRERVIALIRSLPKSLRRSFVPVPEYADACIKAMVPGDKPLIRALSEQLKQMTGTYIPEDAWQEEAMPEYLRMGFDVVDDKGRVIEQGKDLAMLKQRHGGQASGASYHSLSDTGIERSGVKEWDFTDLPESVEIKRGGILLKGFPALVDDGDSVSIQVLDSRENARRESHEGVRRLILLKLAKDVRYLRRNLANIEKLRLQYAKAPTAAKGIQLKGKLDIEWELVTLIVDLTFILGMPEITTGTQFEERITQRKGQLMSFAGEASTLVAEILDIYQSVRKRLTKANRINWMHSIADINSQLDRLVYKGFLQHTPYEQLMHFPRYLQAIEKRLEKIEHAFPRDQQRLNELSPLYRKWAEREESVRSAGKYDSRIEQLRWALEELRVSLFAQELGTAYPVSLKRLEKQWIELGL